MAAPHFSGAGAALDPQVLHQMWFSFAPSCVLAAGVQLDVFSHIAAVVGGRRRDDDRGQIEGVGSSRDYKQVVALDNIL